MLESSQGARMGTLKKSIISIKRQARIKTFIKLITRKTKHRVNKDCMFSHHARRIKKSRDVNKQSSIFLSVNLFVNNIN